MNPNPKKSSDTNSDADTVVECKILWKNHRWNTYLKENKIMFFCKKFFFSYIQVPEHIWKQLEAPFWNNWGQNISLRIQICIWIRKKVVYLDLQKLIRIHNTANNVHLISLQQANYGGMWRWIWVGVSQNFNEHLPVALDMWIMFDLCILYYGKPKLPTARLALHANKTELNTSATRSDTRYFA
jgi:hypothetical protein